MDCLIPTCGSQVKKPCLDENCHNEPTKEPPQGWRRGEFPERGVVPPASQVLKLAVIQAYPAGNPGKPNMVAPPVSTPLNLPPVHRMALSASPPPKETWLLGSRAGNSHMRCQHQSCKFSRPVLLPLRCWVPAQLTLKTAHFHCSLDDPSSTQMRSPPEENWVTGQTSTEEHKEMFQGNPQCWPPTRRLKKSYTVQRSNSCFQMQFKFITCRNCPVLALQPHYPYFICSGAHLELVAAIMNRLDIEYLFYHSISQHWKQSRLISSHFPAALYSSCHYPPQSAIKPFHPQQLSSPCKSSISFLRCLPCTLSHNQPFILAPKGAQPRAERKGGGGKRAEGPFPWLCKASALLP